MLDTYGSYSLLKDKAGVPIKLGQSAWGEVYKAFNGKLRCYAALRLVPRGAFVDDEAREAFTRDVRSATRLRHSSLASVFPLETVGETYLYATEFYNGEALDDVMAREGRLSPARALNVASQVAAVLEMADGVGLLHRRLTARNIIVTEEEDRLAVKVADLALPLTSLLDAGAHRPLDCDFRSPEELAGRPIDPRSAIYSLGALLYYMAVGTEGYRLFRPASLVGEGEPLDDSMNFAPGLIALLNHTLSTDPEARPKTFAELRATLDGLMAAPLQPEPPPKKATPVRPVEAKPELKTATLPTRSLPREAAPTVPAAAAKAPAARIPEEPPRETVSSRPELVVEEEKPPASPPANEPEPTPVVHEPESEEEQRSSDETAGAASGTPVVTLVPDPTESTAPMEAPREASQPFTPPRGAGRKGISIGIWLGLAAVVVLGALFFILFGMGGATKTSVVASTPKTSAPIPSATPVTPPSPTPPPASSGALTVDSDPPGADVSLDDGLALPTPHTFTDVPFGRHHLVGTLSGYTQQRDEVPLDGDTTWHMHLHPMAPATPDPAQVMAKKIGQDQPGSPDWVTDSVDYLRYVRAHAAAPQLDPAAVSKNLETTLQVLRDKQAPMKPSESLKSFQPYALAVSHAAELDVLPAILLLADNEEPHRAFKWYYYAAVQKHDPYAMMKLARLYAKGAGSASGDKDYSDAVIWLQHAAQAGNKTAAAYLDECYLHGIGTPKDPVKAVRDLEVLAQQGVGPAECLLGLSYKNGWGGLDQQTTPLQRQNEALRLFHDAADRGEWDADALIGEMYETGLLDDGGAQLPPDLESAKAAYQKGADNENPVCSFGLGHILYDEEAKGLPYPKLKQKAINLILLAAQAGFPPAQKWLADRPDAGKASPSASPGL